VGAVAAVLIMARDPPMPVGHDLFPVDPKRHFRCDCPTSTFPTTVCSLAAGAGTELANVFASSSKLPPNAENRYGQNFGNLFCWCSTSYGDERFAAETMIQCVLCEVSLSSRSSLQRDGPR
jgi:E3 ubiquitin-protein ligase UBR7